MTKQMTRLGRGWRWVTAFILTLAGLGLANPAAPAALAAPQVAGTFTVSSTADSNASDAFLTLREALLVARGGTGAAGLNRPASSGEKTALGGCSFDGGNFINGGCGPTIADSIVFSAGLGLHPIISLTASLPAITDTAATTIDGSIHGVFPIVSAAAILTNTDALLISSNNNALSGLTFTGAPRDDLHITGDSNQVLTDTVLLKAGRYGLLIDGGDLNFVESALVGTSSPAVGVCSQGNQQGGIILANGAATSTVKMATIACNNGVGVRFDGSATTSDGVISSTITAQSGNGVEFVNGANDDAATGDTVTSNGHYGILISDAATHNITVSNYCSAVGVVCLGVLVLNMISGNTLGGVRLQAGAHSNFVSGSLIGLNRTSTAAFPNGGPGVDIDNAPDNHIGDEFSSGNYNLIAGNAGPGIRFTNTYSGGVGLQNLIGLSTNTGIPVGNGGPGVELINTSNTPVDPFSIKNNAGAGVAVEGTASIGDMIAPAFVGQNGGLPIDLGNDGHTPNGAHLPPGPNNWLNYPVITAASGSLISGTACVNCTVLIYVAIGNPAASGGGAFLWQSATADGAGHWSATLIGGYHSGDISLQACAAPCRHAGDSSDSHSNTSELSPRLQLWVPLVQR